MHPKLADPHHVVGAHVEGVARRDAADYAHLVLLVKGGGDEPSWLFAVGVARALAGRNYR